MKILGIIPARAGSKGLPGKNTLLCAGKPLIRWTVEEALKSKMINHVVLSTESSEISELCQDIDWVKRPEKLAQDETPMLDVIKHVSDVCEEEYTSFIILQPTSPLRIAEQIDKAIRMYQGHSHATSLISMSPVPEKYNPEWLFTMSQNGYLRVSTGRAVKDRITRRQDFPLAYETNGAIYIVSRDNLNDETPNLYGDKVLPYIMQDQIISIDTQEDLIQADTLLKLRQMQ